MAIRDQVSHKAAKQEHVARPASSKPKPRKRSFKTEPWYARAAPKMSAARIKP